MIIVNHLVKTILSSNFINFLNDLLKLFINYISFVIKFILRFDYSYLFFKDLSYLIILLLNFIILYHLLKLFIN